MNMKRTDIVLYLNLHFKFCFSVHHQSESPAPHRSPVQVASVCTLTLVRLYCDLYALRTCGCTLSRPESPISRAWLYSPSSRHRGISHTVSVFHIRLLLVVWCTNAMKRVAR